MCVCVCVCVYIYSLLRLARQCCNICLVIISQDFYLVSTVCLPCNYHGIFIVARQQSRDNLYTVCLLQCVHECAIIVNTHTHTHTHTCTHTQREREGGYKSQDITRHRWDRHPKECLKQKKHGLTEIYNRSGQGETMQVRDPQGINK